MISLSLAASMSSICLMYLSCTFCSLASEFFCSSSGIPSFTAFSERRWRRGVRCARLTFAVSPSPLALLAQLFTAFLCQRRDTDTDDFTVVFRHDTQFRVDDSLFNYAKHALVPRFDGDAARASE